jgi:hypothetical protein
MALYQEELEARLDRLFVSDVPGMSTDVFIVDEDELTRMAPSHSLALGVKMNILLFLPGLLVLLFHYQGIAHGAICGGLILAVQVSRNSISSSST